MFGFGFEDSSDDEVVTWATTYEAITPKEVEDKYKAASGHVGELSEDLKTQIREFTEKNLQLRNGGPTKTVREELEKYMQLDSTKQLTNLLQFDDAVWELRKTGTKFKRETPGFRGYDDDDWQDISQFTESQSRRYRCA